MHNVHSAIGAIAAGLGVINGTWFGVMAFCDDPENSTKCWCFTCIDCGKLCGSHESARDLCAMLYLDSLGLAVLIGGISNSLLCALLIQTSYTKLYITTEMGIISFAVFGAFFLRNFVKTKDGWLDELKTATDGNARNDWKALL